MKRESESRALPNGWQRCRLPEFTHIVMGQSPSSITYNRAREGLPFFQGKAEFGVLHPKVDKYCSQPKKIADQGATLLSIRAPVGPTNLADRDCCIGRGLAAIHPAGSITPRFILYLMRSIEPTISYEGTGSTFTAISKNVLHELSFALPPLNEQTRIVEKIEELFSELVKGIESLKTVRAQLPVYRQALLKHTFEGKLTAQWREENKDKLEKPDQLLGRIKQERAARYEHQFKEWKAAVKIWQECGKSGQKPRKPQTPVTLFLPRKGEIANLPSLPNSWLWIKVQALLAEPLANGHSVKDRASGFPVLRLTAIKTEKLDLSEAKNGDWEYEDALSYLVQRGDFLLARGNGSKRLVGRGGVVPAVERDVAYPDTMIRLRVDPKVVDGSFFSYVWNSRLLREQIEGTARTTAGIYKINQGHILDFMVPLCSLGEQEVVVKRLSVILSTIDAMEATIDNQLLKADELCQSILKKAFSGQLVAQDPNDEPASILLDRIRSECERTMKNKTPRKIKKRKTIA